MSYAFLIDIYIFQLLFFEFYSYKYSFYVNQKYYFEMLNRTKRKEKY